MVQIAMALVGIQAELVGGWRLPLHKNRTSIDREISRDPSNWWTEGARQDPWIVRVYNYVTADVYRPCALPVAPTVPHGRCVRGNEAWRNVCSVGIKEGKGRVAAVGVEVLMTALA